MVDNQAVQTVAPDARSFWYSGNLMKVLVDSRETAGQLAIVQSIAQPGFEPPLHVHSREDETFIVVEGLLQVTCGGEDHLLRSGQAIFAPRGIPHTFRVQGAQVRMITVITPGGFENFFRALALPDEDGQSPAPSWRPSFDRIAEVARRFAVELA